MVAVTFDINTEMKSKRSNHFMSLVV